MFAKTTEASKAHFGRQHFEDALDRLVAADGVVIETYGPASARKAMPGYPHRLLAAAPDLAAMRGVSQCMVQHDDGCAIFQRRPCNCVPDISIVPATGDSVYTIDEQGNARRSSKQ